MSKWLLRYDGFEPAQEGLREALCTLGNGRFATRGAAPESRPDGVHYPGTYAAGVFNRLTDEVAGRRIENESMVNLPDWQSLRFRVEDENWFSLEGATVHDYVQELDLRRGVLSRRFLVEDGRGRRTTVGQRRLVSMADPFVAALQCTVVAENWSGRLVVRSGLDGRAANTGVPRYAGLSATHLRVLAADAPGDDVLALDVETTQSRLAVGVAARHCVLVSGGASDAVLTAVVRDDHVAHEVTLPMRPGEARTVEKVVALYTSRDRAVSDPGEAARRKVASAPDFDRLLRDHVLAWDHLWERCDVEIDDSEGAQRALHVHLFHLMQTVSQHSKELDVGIPARGLHGEAYRGHIFWDETFVHPFLTLRMPELSRGLLLYRWRRLPEARRAAREADFRGAMFPWQSGSDGREETQTWHVNPRSGRWLPDHSRLQRHIGLSVAYNAWKYFQASGDTEFLAQYGAELLLEISLFFSSLATYDPASGRYDIRGVMGPDEYHDGYPWRDDPGLDNNTYTNVMVVWTLRRTLECLDALPDRRRGELLDSLDIRRSDVERWEHMVRKVRVCWLDDDVLAQFEGYERLEELPWGDYVARYGDVSRLDRILEAEGDTSNRYKVSKQADTLMLFFLLTAEELSDVLRGLGYPYTPQLIPRTVDYYRRRTSHGSTLSKVVHAWVLARGDRKAAWEYFREALDSDLADVQTGTTAEGIHLGAMAGTIDLLQRCFTGLEPRGEVLHLDPSLPDALARMHFRLHFRRHSLDIALDHHRVHVRGSPEQPATLRVSVRDQEYVVVPDGVLDAALPTR
ncbi:MAG: glycoside hydrolase family 65 protein [Actinomycetes bacterium]